jgi:hypothetical protein
VQQCPMGRAGASDIPQGSSVSRLAAVIRSSPKWVVKFLVPLIEFKPVVL